MVSDRRNGIYRGLALALGLALTAILQCGYANAAQSKSESEIDDKLGRIEAALQKLPVAPTPDPGCPTEKENRNSDLCAQWKAADSAAESAKWSLATFFATALGILLGIGTLIAAWRAAHWAKEAAIHTNNANELAKGALAQTQAATKAEIQPYVFVERIELVRSQTNPHRASITAVLKNYGVTPALYVRPMIWWQVLDYPLSEKPMHAGMEAEPVGEIAPQQELSVPFPVGESHIGAEVLGGPPGGKALIVHVTLNYENRIDIKGASWSGFYIFEGPKKGFRRLVTFKDERLGGMADT